MKAKSRENLDIIKKLYDIFTIYWGQGWKTETHISVTYYFANNLLASIKVDDMNSSQL